MRLIGALALLGAALGGAVAVLAHYLSRTLPATYDVVGVEVGGRGQQTVVTPLVHPSWWPSLPAAVAVGLALGAATGMLLRRRQHPTTRAATGADGDVTIALTPDEALVLFELLHRWQDAGAVTEPTHQAEQNALRAASCLLERELVEPFDPDYRTLVAAARTRLVKE